MNIDQVIKASVLIAEREKLNAAIAILDGKLTGDVRVCVNDGVTHYQEPAKAAVHAMINWYRAEVFNIERDLQMLGVEMTVPPPAAQVAIEYDELDYAIGPRFCLRPEGIRSQEALPPEKGVDDRKQP